MDYFGISPSLSPHEDIDKIIHDFRSNPVSYDLPAALAAFLSKFAVTKTAINNSGANRTSVSDVDRTAASSFSATAVSDFNILSKTAASDLNVLSETATNDLCDFKVLRTAACDLNIDFNNVNSISNSENVADIQVENLDLVSDAEIADKGLSKRKQRRLDYRNTQKLYKKSI